MKALDRLALAVATCCFLSYIPVWLTRRFPSERSRKWTGAGFVGTLAGWAALGALPEGGWALAGALSAATAAACWASGRADRALGSHDDPRIAVDETVGYWFAVAWLPREPGILLAGFILFRILDAVKMPPYSWLERLPGGYGVVLDDVGAGAAANLLLRGALCLAAR